MRINVFLTTPTKDYLVLFNLPMLYYSAALVFILVPVILLEVVDPIVVWLVVVEIELV